MRQGLARQDDLIQLAGYQPPAVKDHLGGINRHSAADQSNDVHGFSPLPRHGFHAEEGKQVFPVPHWLLPFGNMHLICRHMAATKDKRSSGGFRRRLFRMLR